MPEAPADTAFADVLAAPPATEPTAFAPPPTMAPSVLVNRMAEIRAATAQARKPCAVSRK